MINKELFVKYLEQYQRFNTAFERIEEALMGKKYSSNLYESDWYDSIGVMLDIFLNSHFTEEGCEWINYYLFETIEDKVAYIKQDKDMFNEEKKIEYHLNTLDELWNFLLTDKKLYFKND